MHCPNCKADLDGGLVFDSFFPKYNRVKAREIASMYGATESTGRWCRAIGIEDDSYDGISTWRCPDCQHEWPRFHKEVDKSVNVVFGKEE